MILSLLNMCLQIFSAINDSCTSGPSGRIHTLVYAFNALLQWRGILHKNAFTRVQDSWNENNKIVTLTGLNCLNDDKHPGCQINRHRGLTHSSLGASNAWGSPNWLNITRLCDIWCGFVLWTAINPGYIFFIPMMLSRRLTALPPIIIYLKYILYICLPHAPQNTTSLLLQSVSQATALITLTSYQLQLFVSFHTWSCHMRHRVTPPPLTNLCLC